MDSTAGLGGHAPPGPAQYRRVWARLELESAEPASNTDGTAPIPGWNRGVIGNVEVQSEDVWRVRLDLGGIARSYVDLLPGTALRADLVSLGVRARGRPLRHPHDLVGLGLRAHVQSSSDRVWRTASGLFLVGSAHRPDPARGVFTRRLTAETEAGPTHTIVKVEVLK